MCRQKQHGQVKQQDGRIDCSCIFSGSALHVRFRLGESIRLRVHFGQTFPALPVLDGLRQAAQAVQHEGGELACTAAELNPVVAAALGGDQGNDNAYDCIGAQRQHAQGSMNAANEENHHQAEQKCNADGGDGVGIEHLQQLNVRGDHGNQVSLILSLQLGRAQTAQGPEDLVPNQGQELEGDEMVAGLLSVAQEAPRQCKEKNGGEDPAQGHGPLRVQHVQNGVAAEHRNKRGAEVAEKPHDNGQKHEPQHGPDQTDQPGHDV